jgi:hypothetical protein
MSLAKLPFGNLKSGMLTGLLLILLPAAATARAGEALRPSLAEMSQQIAKLLKGRDEDTIAVGAFTGPARVRSSSGPGIQQILIEELLKRGIRVQNRAKLEIKGDYFDVIDRDSQLLALRLKASVLDRQGEVVVVLDNKTIGDRDAVAQVLGVTKVDLGEGITPEKESRAIKERLENPRVDIGGTIVQADRTSPFAMELQVKDRAGRFLPRNPLQQDGFAFVPINRGEVFAVNLINRSDNDAAVELTLDGLSMFAFNQNRNFRHIVVPKRSSFLVKGWYRNNLFSEEFLITEYGRSAAAELLASQDQIGTITATFAAAWDPLESPPRDESTKFRDPFNPAVGRGRPVATPFREVKKQFGRVRDVVSIRYKKPTQ